MESEREDSACSLEGMNPVGDFKNIFMHEKEYFIPQAIITISEDSHWTVMTLRKKNRTCLSGKRRK